VSGEGFGRTHDGAVGKGEFRSFAVIIKEIDGGLAQLMSIADPGKKKQTEGV